MRHVREKRAKRHHELDPELLRQPHDLGRKRPPAQVRLDPEEQDGVPLLTRELGVVEGVDGPVDAACDPVDERNVRAGGLEVVELLRIDVPEPAGRPGLGEVARSEGSTLRAVVPAAEGGDQDGVAKSGATLDAKVPGD